MIGGYLTFAGIEGKGHWHSTPVEDVLPVIIGATDDRVEAPSGATPGVVAQGHPVAHGLDGPWPSLLGYNRLTARPGSEVVAVVDQDPLIVVGAAGLGRSAVFASDCAPHWAPPEFLDWSGYAKLWNQLVSWTVGANDPAVTR